MNERSLSWKEFTDILKRIDEKHSFRICRGRYIKYIDPVLDMRDRKVFHIKFRGLSDKEFDFRDSEETMFKRINEWLEEGEKCFTVNL